MKTSFKRIATWVLAMLMLLSCVTALAEDGSVIEFGDVVNVGDQIVPLAASDAEDNAGRIQIGAEEGGIFSKYTYYRVTVPIYYYTDNTVVITNDNSQNINTGITMDSIPNVVLLALAVVDLAAVSMKKRYQA